MASRFQALPDYPARLGPKQMITGDYTGPSSYDTAGDTIGATNNLTGVTVAGLSAIDQIIGSGSATVTGAYTLTAQPSGTGPRKTWKIFWSSNGAVSTVAINVAGSGMTIGTYLSSAATGGAGGSGAQVSVNVTSATVATVTLVSGGRGYTTLPTGFTVATGGTPPTFTITGSLVGQPVAASTDLSAEKGRLSLIGR